MINNHSYLRTLTLHQTSVLIEVAHITIDKSPFGIFSCLDFGKIPVKYCLPSEEMNLRELPEQDLHFFIFIKVIIA